MNIEEIQTADEFKSFIRNYNGLFDYDKLGKYLMQDLLIDGIILKNEEPLRSDLIRTGIIKWLEKNIDLTECKDSIRNLKDDYINPEDGIFRNEVAIARQIMTLILLENGDYIVNDIWSCGPYFFEKDKKELNQKVYHLGFKEKNLRSFILCTEEDIVDEVIGILKDFNLEPKIIGTYKSNTLVEVYIDNHELTKLMEDKFRNK